MGVTGNRARASPCRACAAGSCSHGYHEALLQQALLGEARGAAASRLYIETAAVEPIQAVSFCPVPTRKSGAFLGGRAVAGGSGSVLCLH